ncbi:MAG: PAS domain S-box protein [Proteobacteria bacterium]|nr:PAS domain S-box protein [Pseudomonadota bacterium]
MAERADRVTGSGEPPPGDDLALIESALAASGAALFDHDLSAERLAWRTASGSVFGHTPASLARLTDFVALIPAEDRPALRAAYQTTLGTEGPTPPVRYRIRHADGSLRLVEVHGRVQWSDGRPVRSVGLLIDVSERSALEQQLRLHAQVLDAIADGVTMAREDGTILMVNRAIEAMHGWSREELVGGSTRVFSGLSPAEHARLRAHVQGVVTRDGRWFGETLERRRDGRPLRVRRSMALLHDGKERLWVGTRTDVTELRALEREVLEAAEREQQRLGQWLHEGIGQELAGAALLAATLAHQATAAGSPLAASAAALAERLGHLTGECRRLAHRARGFVLASGGLALALEALARDCEATHALPCEAIVDGEFAAAVDGERAQVLHRIAADAIEAAVAGRPMQIGFELGVGADTFWFRLWDDGEGPFPDDALRHLRYRAGELFGTPSVEYHDPRGRELVVRFPKD